MLNLDLIEGYPVDVVDESYDSAEEAPLQSVLHQICRRQLAESVIQQYRHELLMFIRQRVASPADADDLLQDVCLKIAASQRLDQIDRLKSYVFTIAANTLRNQYRSRARQVAMLSVPLESVELTDNSWNPQDMVECLDSIDDLYQKIDKLSPRCKQVFLMNRVEGCSYKAVGKALSISTSMVEKHVSRGLKVVRELDRVG